MGIQDISFQGSQVIQNSLKIVLQWHSFCTIVQRSTNANVGGGIPKETNNTNAGDGGDEKDLFCVGNVVTDAVQGIKG